METIYFKNTADLKRNIKEIEKKLNVKITIKNKDVSIEGEGITEYEASRVLDAMASGFSSKVALMLKENDLIFKKISMKDITKRPDMKTVRARVIGKHGQTKHTIETVSDSYIAIQGNDVSIISSPDTIEEAITALKNLIRGSKQSNVYHFLESMNTSRKSLPEDLGIKSPDEPTKYELKKKREAEKKLKESISELKRILGDEKEILKLIKKEVNELKSKYGDERRTRVIKVIKEIEEKDLVLKQDVVITITEKGYIKRMPFKSYNEQKRGGKGVIGTDLSTDDFVKQLLTCSTHDYLLLFTRRGRLMWLKAHKVPETQRYGKGQAIVNLLNIKDDEISSVMPVKDFKDYLFMVTKKGMVKKINLSMFAKPRNVGVRIINLPADNSDSVVDVKRIMDKQQVMLMSADGQAIRFNSDEVRNMGRASYGVAGIKLDKGDEVVSMEIVPMEKTKSNILTITEKGYGKRSEIDDYRLTGRAGKGVINLKVSEKTGKVIRTIELDEKDTIVVTTKKGMAIRTKAKAIRVMGRAAQGVRVINLKQGDRVGDVAKLVEVEDVSEIGENKE